MILRFSLQPNSSHSQIFRKAGQKKAEPNRPIDICTSDCDLPTFGFGFGFVDGICFSSVT
jgi:hypothetical protein